MDKRKVFLILVLIILGTVTFITFRLMSGGEVSTSNLKLFEVRRGDITSKVSATGTIQPKVTVEVKPEVETRGGRIIKLFIEEGSVVKRGEHIIKLDSSIQEAIVKQARANLESARAALVKAKVTLDDAKRTWERQKELIAKDLISQAEADSAQTQYEVASAQYQIALAEVSQAKAALERAQADLDSCTIKAPISGTVIEKNMEEGQTVNPGTLIAKIADIENMQMVAQVDETDIGKVKVGQRVEVTVDSYPERVFKGLVGKIALNAKIVQNVTTFDVTIDIPNLEGLLRSGMTGNASILIGQRKDVLYIPNEALRSKDGRNTVLILENKDKKPKSKGVKVGFSDGERTEILEGLKEGERVLLGSSTKPVSQTQVGPPAFPLMPGVRR